MEVKNIQSAAAYHKPSFLMNKKPNNYTKLGLASPYNCPGIYFGWNANVPAFFLCNFYLGISLSPLINLHIS